MTLKIKWHLRQLGADVLTYLLCFTTILVVVPIAVRYYHFMTYGLDMYPGIKWPKTVFVGNAARAFWEYSVWPRVQWVPLTVVADVVFRRFLFRTAD